MYHSHQIYKSFSRRDKVAPSFHQTLPEARSALIVSLRLQALVAAIICAQGGSDYATFLVPFFVLFHFEVKYPHLTGMSCGTIDQDFYYLQQKIRSKTPQKAEGCSQKHKSNQRSQMHGYHFFKLH